MANLDFTNPDHSLINIDHFIQNSIINDEKNSNGVLRLNRFYGVIHGLKGFMPKGYDSFLSWNIFKVDCPSIKLESESREVDMIPRIYFKNYVYDDLSISYIESSELRFRRFFAKWMKNVLDPNSYSRKYYNDVKADSFKVYPINFKGTAYTYDIFYDIVPFEINSINYDVQDDASQTVLTTVKFKYLRHEVLPNLK